jgi:hypothetical protein
VLVGNPIAGAILTSSSGFEGLEAFGGAVGVFASVLMVLSWELLRKFQAEQRQMLVSN